MNKKKKAIIITSVVLASFVIIGIVYALLSDSIAIKNKFKVGTVNIDTYDLKLTANYGDTNSVQYVAPSDITTLSWTTENKGTLAVLSRQTLEIRWTGNLSFYMYPANMTEEAILADYAKIQAGEESQAIVTEPITEEVNGETKTVGLRYSFVSDVLDGTSNTSEDSVSSEVNYNMVDETTEGESPVDASINTDDTDKLKDKVAFRLLLNPRTNYLNQGKIVSIKVKTEGMQYTTEGSQEGNWVAADVEEIADPEGN